LSHDIGRLDQVDSSHSFILVSIRLSQSHELGYGFGGLTRIDLCCFSLFPIFLWFIFQFHPLILDLLGIGVYIYIYITLSKAIYILFLMRLSWFYNSSHGFDKLTHIFFYLFFLNGIFFFNFIILSFNIGLIENYGSKLFWFTFYEVIIVSWPDCWFGR